MHVALRQFLEGKITFGADEERFIGEKFKFKTVKRNEILVDKGQVARHIYFVVSGALRIFLVNDNANEFTRFLIFENHIGTAFPSFINRQPSAAVVQSVEASELLTLSYADRELLLKNIQGWETMERLSIEQEYIASIERIENFLSMNSADRYNMLLQNAPEIIKRMPAKIVADYLGISQETLSRLKTKKSI